MDRTEIANLEDAGRAAMAWLPEGQDDRVARRQALLLTAGLPAAGIIALAAILLLAVL